MISSGTTARQGKAPALGPARLLPLPCAFVGKIRGIDMAVKSPSKITGPMETPGVWGPLPPGARRTDPGQLYLLGSPLTQAAWSPIAQFPMGLRGCSGDAPGPGPCAWLRAPWGRGCGPPWPAWCRTESRARAWGSGAPGAESVHRQGLAAAWLHPRQQPR